MISQAAGSRGGPFSGQSAKRPQAGVLVGLLGGVEVAEVAQQGADRLGPRRGQGGASMRGGQPVISAAAAAGKADAATGRIS